MAVPLSIPDITDLEIGASGTDVLQNQAAALLDEPSFIQIFASRESVDVTLQVKVGDVEVVPLGPCALDATVGNAPVVPDDLLYFGMGKKGQRIQILGTNANAAAQELKTITRIVSVSDAMIQPQLLQL